jgi:hypothetical protein
MFSDPQSVTVSGSAKTLNRLNSTPNGSEFSTADRAYKASITHTYGRRHRHTLRLQSDTLVANPLVSGQNINQSMSVYLTVDVPPGYDTATAKAVVDGLIANLSASTGANITKLVGGES